MIKVENRESYLTVLKTFLPEFISACEIGVYRGDFSQMILDKLNPYLLVLIDSFEVGKSEYSNGLPTSYSNISDYEYVKNRFTKGIGKNISVVNKYSFDAVNDYPIRLFNFIYIDASHLYEDVKRDLNEWLPKLKYDGLLCGHDYIEHEDFGVIQAVDEFCKENNFEIILLSESGDFALKEKL